MSVTDEFESYREGLSTPAMGAFDITPGSALQETTRAVYIGGGGNLECTMDDGSTVTFIGLSAGVIYPLRVSAVASGNTTATSIIGLV